ncbi:MAG: family transcriptional regulator protein [Frankiales bacterium]|nr:family transcriptional regulator protein [Frankiales bacterium]
MPDSANAPARRGEGPDGPVLLTTHLIGDLNRSRVLQAFCDHGPLSRAELARLAGVPRATIGAIIQGLLDDGLLEEQEPDRDGKVGKPGRPLWFAPHSALSVAVGFGDGAVRASLVSARGERLADAEVPLETATATPAALLAAVERAIRIVLPRHAPVLGVGVVVPGVCDTTAGEVIGSGQLPGSVGAGLATTLAERLGVTVLVDNDARAQALGEKWFGDARGIPTFASVQTGTGLGVGLVLAGQLYRGDDGRTGELGHTQVVPDGAACRCGLAGCWETVATLPWLRAQARKARLPGAARATTASLTAAGTPGADALLQAYADNLAVGLANLVNLLGTRRIVLHGDVVGGGEPMRARIEAATRERCLGYLRADVQVTLSALDADAALLGAAGLVLSETWRLAV